ncbi:MAG: hypothetical protein KDC71_18005 [Acidobacteria bacterium]|nr:hypothetical protein [Acidobacteriota bacterium]
MTEPITNPYQPPKVSDEGGRSRMMGVVGSVLTSLFSGVLALSMFLTHGNLNTRASILLTLLGVMFSWFGYIGGCKWKKSFTYLAVQSLFMALAICLLFVAWLRVHGKIQNEDLIPLCFVTGISFLIFFGVSAILRVIGKRKQKRKRHSPMKQA